MRPEVVLGSGGDRSHSRQAASFGSIGQERVYQTHRGFESARDFTSRTSRRRGICHIMGHRNTPDEWV